MVIAKDVELAKASPIEEIALPPTGLYSDEPPFETDIHLRQILILLSSLEWLWQDRQGFFASGNLTVYYSPKQLKSRDFRGPDFFVVLDTERRTKLRFFSADGSPVETPEEAAKSAWQVAEEAQQRTDRLAEKLRELGVDPESV